ncbi:YqjF family protein [Pseudocnuella soli]|uniref:YqjF family protein n=1 Tax=Pseudocnuella soli TaxID=2502779 RepID=UPI001046F66D|nr:DUF2071 domain-containing protein [Pseudocnuella soli]
MRSIDAIINAIDHRPWELPATRWTYCQEWNRALFLHWKVPQDLLRPLVPPGLELDMHNSETWVSLVAFTMEQIRPRGLPAVGFVSNFEEINLRTYVRVDNKPGVYFLSIEAGNGLFAFIARNLSGLPYETAAMLRRNGANQPYTSINKRRDFQLQASFKIGSGQSQKSALDHFLTEKYCLYLQKGNTIYRYDIHHRPWNLYTVEQLQLKVAYRVGGIALSDQPDIVHYSDGVQVLAWNKVPVV